jgi:hypothetical protein
MKSLRLVCRVPLVAAFVATVVAFGDESPRLRITWENNTLSISGPEGPSPLPGRLLAVNYLEAYCRAGSTERDWRDTVVKHVTRLVDASDDGRELLLECRLADGVVVRHKIVAAADDVDFRLVAHNPTQTASDVHWAQPCIRVAGFTGRTQETYLPSCFVLIGGKVARLPTMPWATVARYTPGQVYCPAAVPRTDVNPRPLSSIVPSGGLIGCFSADGKWIMASAWEPYQELFQGVITCVHSDFRIGGLAAGKTKEIRGKIYLTRDNIDALLARYHRDFPEHTAGKAKSPAR